VKRVAQFVAWYWNKLEIGERCLFGIVSWCLPWMISCYWIGITGLIYLMAGIVTAMVGFLLYQFYLAFSKQWKMFSREVPPDDIRIMNKLRGFE
jgi:hypothetical protein